MRTCLRLILAALFVGPFTGASATAQEKGEPKKHTANTPTTRSDNYATEKHKEFLALAKKGGVDLLFLGDAATAQWTAEGIDGKPGPGAKIFDKEFAPLKAANFGLNADKTQNLLWRLQNGELDGITPKVVVLLIGTNNSNGKDNTAEEIADGIKAVVEEIHKKSPKSKVLLLGILPRGADPAIPNIKAQREKIAEVNKSIAKLDDGGKSVKFLDLTDKFVKPDGTISNEVMHNYVHLTEKGYQIWADGIKGPITELMGK